MNALKYLLAASLGILSISGCTEQRDLFIVSSPSLLIESDWTSSKINTDEGATAIAFDGSNSSKNLMPNATKQLITLKKGNYDFLVFNGLMYSENESHLDYIQYRGVNEFETFEAYATEMESRSAFRAASDEIVINNPDILATQSMHSIDIEGLNEYEMIYDNGKKQNPPTGNYVEDSLLFMPCRITHTCQVKVHLTNSKSVRIARGSIKGFSNSVYLASRMPSHTFVTQQFVLSTLVSDPSDPGSGTASSPTLNTFGPPLDLPGRTYSVELRFLLINNEEYGPYNFDITDQVEQAIAYLKKARLANTAITETITITIGDIKLPKVSSDNMDVGVNDWGNNIIIPAPFK